MCTTQWMAKTPSAPEKDKPRTPQPELKLPKKPEPEIKYPRDAEKEVFEKDDQADSGPDKDNLITRSSEASGPRPDPQDAHIGATEDQVSDTAAPSGDEFKDEPKQG